MADAASTPTGSISYGRGPGGQNFAILSWTSIGGTATGSWLECPGVPESVHITPTASFGGATVVLQGSNEPVTTSSPVAVGLTSDGSAAISATANLLKKIHENVTLVRPVSSGGTSTAVNVHVKVRLT
jgi:hypothetical protein